jgi:hypothetical protein
MPSLKYYVNTMGWFILVYIIGGVLFMPKTTPYTWSTFRRVSQKYITLHNISFETWRGIAWPYQNLQEKQYQVVWGIQ